MSSTINVSKDTIGLLVVNAMHMAERDRSMIGTEKKSFVLQRVKSELGETTFERYQPLLEVLIDLLVSISRKEIELVLNKTKRCLTSFGSC